MAVLPVSRAIRGTTLLCFDSLVCLELGQRRRLRGLGRGNLGSRTERRTGAVATRRV